MVSKAVSADKIPTPGVYIPKPSCWLPAAFPSGSGLESFGKYGPQSHASHTDDLEGYCSKAGGLEGKLLIDIGSGHIIYQAPLHL